MPTPSAPSSPRPAAAAMRLPAPWQRLLPLALATTLAALAGLSHAQPADGAAPGPRHAVHHPGGHGGHGMAPGLPGRALDAIGASSEQKAKIREIFEAARQDLRPDPGARRAEQAQLAEILAAPQIDAAAAEALRQKREARHEAASKRMLQAMIDAHQVLTPEQRQKLAAHMKAHADRHPPGGPGRNGRHGHHEGPPRG